MKRIFPGLLLAILMLAACDNEPNDFEDYSTQSVYFPLQTPIRTLVLGEDRIDNSIDLEKAFHIGVSVGGMYENTADRIVDFILDPTILPELAGFDSLYGKDMNGVTRKLFILPANYYTMVPVAQVTVPKGSFNGLIRINLNDNFFNDPNAHNLRYVLPLRITGVSDGFSILTGKLKDSQNPAPRWWEPKHWEASKMPKDITLFAVKYINPLHGTYFQRGVQIKNGILDRTFHAIDISANQTAVVATLGLNKSIYYRMGNNSGVYYQSLLTFTDDADGDGIGDITVSPVPGALGPPYTGTPPPPVGTQFPYNITGTGKYYKTTTDFAKENGWTIDPITRQVIGSVTITLNFTVSGGGFGTDVYQYQDTLVLRDNSMRYEEFTVARPVPL